ncbi:tripartite tricarboxylate transporter permease [Phenylobacterium sp.]|uniref:tripartite tricarboxylate transporter permease n=1 Tax=Phenylobacterium sp. TaxID=1871053 RepID=UPI0027215FB0|nr:tripartite tricarboxylate transporter permease [Phenylobacterium sp.]MDO8379094.1 tripartite tricarboxylate transporter permease [Phenylobacterium sp.]
MDLALGALASLMASPAALAALLLGTLAGLLAGLTPGVNGRAGLLLVTPIALGFGPSAGAVFLIAFHSVVHTSGSIPAILLGAPTSASEAATAIDGYAMARRGEAARAVGATLTASAFGGLVGALFLFLALPAALMIITHVGTPEITALSLLGLLSIAALSGGWLTGGLMAAALGVLIASVGVDPFSATPRLTFGVQDLWDGVNAAALVTGLFVVPELAAREPETQVATPPLAGYSQVLKGCLEVVEHRWLMLRSSLIGVAVGVIPGLGASAAVWIAYGHARQTHPSAVPYGEGAIAGVIAPEAANNSKEGGSLVPTLFLGIPGSSGMGILLAAFATLGVEVGPRMLAKTPEFVFQLGWTNIASNLLAVPLCLVMAPAMARFAMLRRSEVVPVALAAALAATALTQAAPATLFQLVVFSGLGLLFKAANLPRAPLLLGFVLGPGLESGLIRSDMIYGWSALIRPGVLVILGLSATIVAASSWTRLRAGSRTREPGAPLSLPAVALTGVLSASAIWVATTLPATAAGILYLSGGVGVITAAACAVRFWRERESASTPAAPDGAILMLLLGAVAITGLVSLPLGVGAFVCSALVIRGGVSYRKAILIALLTTCAVLGLQTLQR